MNVKILGSRGIPAKHGGFETFAEDLSLFLASRGHRVTVYCQIAANQHRTEDVWNGVHRILIPAADHPLGTIEFDWKATWHAAESGGVILTLGYNTAVFNLIYRLRHVQNAMNMDGLEWKRKKWTVAQRAWLWFNEWAGARLANHLIADHPEIARHLERHTSAAKITTIPYGADEVIAAPSEPLRCMGLKPKGYYLLIARPEPENSILEIVQAFSSPAISVPLVILGDYSSKSRAYQRQVMDAAGPNIKFVGPIYDREIARSLRFHARAYVHGHRVGGTNPSLVEALAAGNPIIAHDNVFTRWVAGNGAKFFNDAGELIDIASSLERDPGHLATMELTSRRRYHEEFTQEKILSAYEALLIRVGQRGSQ